MDEQNVTQIEEQEQENPTTESEEAVADELKDKISETLEKSAHKTCYLVLVL